MSVALSTNQNPSYIETGGEKATIKPWFWVLWLFLGPTISSIAYQWYIFIAVSHLINFELGTSILNTSY
jgi:hypothetical protein